LLIAIPGGRHRYNVGRVRLRILKWVSLGLGAIVALAVLAVLVVVWLVDPNSFKSNIEAAVRDATGRELTLVGDIDLGFFPWLAFRTGEGRFGNAAGFGPEPMVSWQSAQLGARLVPLLRGRLVADRVILKGADVRLVRRADGSTNWQDLLREDPADPGTAQSATTELRIDGITIENSRVSFVDETVPRRMAVSALNLTTDGIAPGEPFTDTEISGVLHMDGFASAGVPFRLAVPKAVVPEDMGAVDVAQFSIAFGGFEAEGAVQGTLGEQPKLAGRLGTNVFDLRGLLTSVGIAAPKTSDAAALGRLQVAATWKLDAGTVDVDPFTLTLDDTRFSGSFRRGAGEDPTGVFALRGDTLDIARYIPPPDPASEPFVLPTAALKALKFHGSVELEQARLDDIEMKGVTLRLVLDDQGLRPQAP
jgi:AsmA protein